MLVFVVRIVFYIPNRVVAREVMVDGEGVDGFQHSECACRCIFVVGYFGVILVPCLL